MVHGVAKQHSANTTKKETKGTTRVHGVSLQCRIVHYQKGNYWDQ